MLFSLAVIFLCGMLLGGLCKKLKLPPLLGMLLTGILLGPHALDVLDGSILAISADLRRIALIIILTRAGLNLELADLKRAGRPAVLLCFVPACFEIAGMVLLAPRLLGISVLDAAIMGSVVAAVSPAVIVPKMLRLMEEGRGTRAGIPQMIMAGARWTMCSLSFFLRPSPGLRTAAVSRRARLRGSRSPLCWAFWRVRHAVPCWRPCSAAFVCGTAQRC